MKFEYDETLEKLKDNSVDLASLNKFSASVRAVRDQDSRLRKAAAEKQEGYSGIPGSMNQLKTIAKKLRAPVAGDDFYDLDSLEKAVNKERENLENRLAGEADKAQASR